MTPSPPVGGRDGVSGGVGAPLHFSIIEMAAHNAGGAGEVLMLAVPPAPRPHQQLFLAKEQQLQEAKFGYDKFQPRKQRFLGEAHGHAGLTLTCPQVVELGREMLHCSGTSWVKQHRDGALEARGSHTRATQDGFTTLVLSKHLQLALTLPNA